MPYWQKESILEIHEVLKKLMLILNKFLQSG